MNLFNLADLLPLLNQQRFQGMGQQMPRNLLNTQFRDPNAGPEPELIDWLMRGYRKPPYVLS